MQHRMRMRLSRQRLQYRLSGPHVRRSRCELQLRCLRLLWKRAGGHAVRSSVRLHDSVRSLCSGSSSAWEIPDHLCPSAGLGGPARQSGLGRSGLRHADHRPDGSCCPLHVQLQSRDTGQPPDAAVHLQPRHSSEISVPAVVALIRTDRNGRIFFSNNLLPDVPDTSLRRPASVRSAVPARNIFTASRRCTGELQP